MRQTFIILKACLMHLIFQRLQKLFACLMMELFTGMFYPNTFHYRSTYGQIGLQAVFYLSELFDSQNLTVEIKGDSGMVCWSLWYSSQTLSIWYTRVFLDDWNKFQLECCSATAFWKWWVDIIVFTILINHLPGYII